MTISHFPLWLWKVWRPILIKFNESEDSLLLVKYGIFFLLGSTGNHLSNLWDSTKKCDTAQIVRACDFPFKRKQGSRQNPSIKLTIPKQWNLSNTNKETYITKIFIEISHLGKFAEFNGCSKIRTFAFAQNKMLLNEK